MKKIIIAALFGITLSSPFGFAMERESNESLTVAPTLANYEKYMTLSEQDRSSPQARADLLAKWEKITFRDYTIEDLRRIDWEKISSEEQKKDDERCLWELETKQARFILGNDKDVRFSTDLYLAIMDREDQKFFKDGHQFQLVPRNNTKPLPFIDFFIHEKEYKPLEFRGWVCELEDENSRIAFEIIDIGELWKWKV